VILTDEKRKAQLEEIVNLMNKEAEHKLLQEEGSPEWKHCNDILEALKSFVEKLEEHERTYVEQGLMDRKDIHDVYWSNPESKSQHQREKEAALESKRWDANNSPDMILR